MQHLSKLSHKLCINVCFTSFRTQRQPTEEYSAKIRNRYTVCISLILTLYASDRFNSQPPRISLMLQWRNSLHFVVHGLYSAVVIKRRPKNKTEMMQLEMEKKKRHQLNYHQRNRILITLLKACKYTYIYNCCITGILLDKTWALVVVIMHFYCCAHFAHTWCICYSIDRFTCPVLIV